MTASLFSLHTTLEYAPETNQYWG